MTGLHLGNNVTSPSPSNQCGVAWFDGFVGAPCRWIICRTVLFVVAADDALLVWKVEVLFHLFEDVTGEWFC